MLKFEEFKDMLEKQYVLNEHFNGKNWEEKLKTEDVKLAILTECAEFFEEVPKWKWWKPYKMKEIDKRKQYEELIDILHFAMTLMMKIYDTGDVLKEYETSRVLVMKEYKLKKSFGYYDITRFVFDFLNEPNILNYLLLIQALLVYANLEWDKIYNVYLQKNEKNHKRIEAGYMEGNETIKQQEGYVEV